MAFTLAIEVMQIPLPTRHARLAVWIAMVAVTSRRFFPVKRTPRPAPASQADRAD
jgi:hypothetical protein